MIDPAICPCGCGRSLPPVAAGTFPEAIDFVERWLTTNSLTIAEVRAKDNRPVMVRVRREIASYLHAHGWPSTHIGRYLERDHTTVLHHILKAGQVA